MKTLFLLFVLVCGLASAQTPGFRQSGTPNPFVTAVHSNQTFIVDRGGGLPPANFTFGSLALQLRTNIVEPLLPELHMRRNDMFQLWDQVSSNRPVRFLIVGDSVADANETTRGVRRAFDGYMDNGGYRTMFTENFANTGDSLHYYLNLTPVYSAYSPSFYCPMTAGQVASSFFPSGSSPTVDTLDVDFHVGSELSTLVIETNAGGSWGTIATIDATVGTQGEFVTRRYALNPIGKYNIRVTSSGSNNLANVGLTRLFARRWRRPGVKTSSSPVCGRKCALPGPASK